VEREEELSIICIKVVVKGKGRNKMLIKQLNHFNCSTVNTTVFKGDRASYFPVSLLVVRISFQFSVCFYRFPFSCFLAPFPFFPEL